MYIESIIPTIVVYTTPDFDFSEEILWGIEEEGIPYTLVQELFEENIAQAYKASQESLLEIGVAYSKKGIVIHDKKLPCEVPLLTTTTVDKKTCRIYGSNAARFVKGLPIIEL